MLDELGPAPAFADDLVAVVQQGAQPCWAPRQVVVTYIQDQLGLHDLVLDTPEGAVAVVVIVAGWVLVDHMVKAPLTRGGAA
jgi:hypothetical protein